ncbi:MAG TPA: RNA-binding protein [Polyangiaceae bacterium]|jgi:RNA recognition motif-containing protein|nr:RNA-binding protein [Polyangiaceae bacterium]
MNNRLFARNLSLATNDELLREAFKRFGTVTSAHVVLDRTTGASRGFGFVSFADSESAKQAMREMNGVTLDGRVLGVAEARERE